jgi:hypothetical protein
VVASLLGPLKGNREHSASRLLMPRCFAASVGGILTWLAKTLETAGLRDLGHHEDLPLDNLVEVVVGAGSMPARLTIRENDSVPTLMQP